MPADRARRAGDQLAAPAARPGVGGLHELGGQPLHVDRVRDALDQLAGAPPRRAVGRRLHGPDLEPAERRVDGVHPRHVAAVVADGQARGALDPRERDAGAVAAELVHGRLGIGRDAERAARAERGDVLADRRRGHAEAADAAQPREDVQLGLELRQERDEHAARGQVRRDRRRERGEHRGGERGQRGLVDRQPLVVERRLHHLQPQQAVALEPLGHDREHVAARLGTGADGFDERLALLLSRWLEERVDASFGVDEPLRLQAEHQNRRLLHVPARTRRGLILVSGGHKCHHRDGGKGRRAPAPTPQ